MTTDKTSPDTQHNDEIERLKAENADLRRKLEASEVFEAMFKNHRDELLNFSSPEPSEAGARGQE